MNKASIELELSLADRHYRPFHLRHFFSPMKLTHPLILLLLALAGGGTAMATAPSSRRRRSLRPRRWQGGQPSSGGGGSPRHRSSRDPTWRPIAATLVKRGSDAMASVPGGKVYAIGGGGYGQPITARVSGYDPATNAWAAAPSLGTARYELAAAVLNGTLYALGGRNNNYGWLTLVETFTPTAAGGGTWATGAHVFAVMS